ncbi:hypothetical protein DL98DRAFT_522971 [Cadophora sp. DSE1049]|nr:hypothetical protein DL98DRAFT_522971 [Cadophora sp. DSE1049]
MAPMPREESPPPPYTEHEPLVGNVRSGTEASWRLRHPDGCLVFAASCTALLILGIYSTYVYLHLSHERRLHQEGGLVFLYRV